MQGDELKAIRHGLGMTQAEFASELGLSSTFIGLMERDVKPIERRTALAVRYLSEHPECLTIDMTGAIKG